MPALLALFLRSLRELLRSRMSYAVLVIMLGVIFLFLLGAQAGATATTAPGLAFFQNSLFVELVFITLAGVSYFATAITEEKEEGTLGLLRMTDLDPLAILLGKSTSRLGAALLLLAATLPFTLLAVTLGGISARQVFACYLCMGGYLVLLANVALLASVLSPRGAYSTLATTVVVLGTQGAASLLIAAPGWLGGLPIGSRIAFLFPALTSVGEVLRVVNPFRRLGEILTTGFVGSVVSGQLWWSLVLALGCLGVAWLLFDLATGESKSWGLPRLVPRPNSRWATYSPGRAWLVSALAWKDYHFQHGGRPLEVLRWVVYGGLAVGLPLATFRTIDSLRGSLAGAFWIINWIFALEMALVGSRIVRSEIRDQTLTSLAGLPLAMSHVMLMKLNGAKRALRPGVVCMAIAIAALISIDVYGASVPNSGISTGLSVGTLFGWCYFFSQAWLLAHLAGYFSLSLKWGALPVSLGVVFLANVIGAIFCVGIFILPIVGLTYSSSLRTTIYQRLEGMASAD